MSSGEFCNEDLAGVIGYEFRMFAHLCERLHGPFESSGHFEPGNIELTGSSDDTEYKRDLSAQLEGLLLHARILRDFFYYFEFKKHATGRWRDDLMAQDFIPDWTLTRPPAGDYLCENKERMDKAVAHLTKKRVEYKSLGMKWDVPRLRGELQPVIDHFKERLTPETRGWFEPRDEQP